MVLFLFFFFLTVLNYNKTMRLKWIVIVRLRSLKFTFFPFKDHIHMHSSSLMYASLLQVHLLVVVLSRLYVEWLKRVDVCVAIDCQHWLYIFVLLFVCCSIRFRSRALKFMSRPSIHAWPTKNLFKLVWLSMRVHLDRTDTSAKKDLLGGRTSLAPSTGF